MYSEMLPEYQRNPAAFDLPADVMIVWPDDNDGHMRGLPSGLGRWKHGVYYHLAYLGGNLTKQLTHTVGPSVIAEQFDKIVKSGATEYMLVNVSEVRDYVMGARMLADITWDAPAIYATPDPAGRYTAWWSREYFGAGTNSEEAAKAANEAYHQYFALLDVPEKLWQAPDAIEDLLDRLYLKVAGKAYPPVDSETMARMHSRNRQLQDALEAVTRAERLMPRAQQQFFSVAVALGVRGGAATNQSSAPVGRGVARSGCGSDVAVRSGGAHLSGAAGDGTGAGRVSTVRPLVRGELDPPHAEPEQSAPSVHSTASIHFQRRPREPGARASPAVKSATPVQGSGAAPVENDPQK